MMGDNEGGTVMAVITSDITVDTKGFCHLEDITDLVQTRVTESGLADGIACVSVVGSTAGISTIEYEPGLLQDVPEFLESLLPSGVSYHHDDTWHDGNGFAHLRFRESVFCWGRGNRSFSLTSTTGRADAASSFSS
jgi:thiamine phosphate synthase YjbQ (UPF0047 family)